MLGHVFPYRCACKHVDVFPKHTSCQFTHVCCYPVTARFKTNLSMGLRITYGAQLSGCLKRLRSQLGTFGTKEYFMEWDSDHDAQVRKEKTNKPVG